MLTTFQQTLKYQLDKAVENYNSSFFIDTDPIQIPHGFVLKEDIEIAGFMSASIAWGQRKTIINNAKKLMQMMDNTPHDFVMHASTAEIELLKAFVHRTFNGNDLIYFVHSLRNIYEHSGGLETVFTQAYGANASVYEALQGFREAFLQLPHVPHVRKHVSDVSANSAAKRLHMFLRWMVRVDDKGVDFGLWKNISPAHLMLPLDVHTGDVARAMGILNRKQNDYKAVIEITDFLRLLDTEDPIKYDFALFGLGAFDYKNIPIV